MRFLIVLGLLILLYYLVKGWIFSSKQRQMGRGGGERELESEMVKDPHCKTYIPKDSAIHARLDGRDYYFCSKECMSKFRDEMEGNRYERRGK
ncbi:MAG: YHS domain-containing protein [Syntrophobacterales bacterium]|nr:MAG: YHS domain-containing protein [Syntrophobacterales bacterium]